MKSQSKNWADPFIAMLFMLNVLLLVHLLQYEIIAEQSAQIMAVLLYYGWLSKWMKRI